MPRTDLHLRGVQLESWTATWRLKHHHPFQTKRSRYQLFLRAHQTYLQRLRMFLPTPMQFRPIYHIWTPCLHSHTSRLNHQVRSSQRPGPSSIEFFMIPTLPLILHLMRLPAPSLGNSTSHLHHVFSTRTCPFITRMRVSRVRVRCLMDYFL